MQSREWPVPAPPPGRALDQLDLRESIRVMQQRSVKMVMVITGIIVGIAALFIATWLVYTDEPDAAKTPTTAVPQP
jgi:hypothetical protein